MGNKELYEQLVDGIDRLIRRLGVGSPEGQVFAASCLVGLGTKMLHQAGVQEDLVHTVISSCWTGATGVLTPDAPVDPSMLN